MIVQLEGEVREVFLPKVGKDMYRIAVEQRTEKSLEVGQYMSRKVPPKKGEKVSVKVRVGVYKNQVQFFELDGAK